MRRINSTVRSGSSSSRSRTPDEAPDCGATTCTGLCDLGIERDEIDSILISHFHGDHYAGIPILLLAALYEDERKHALRIVGPPGVEQRVHEMAARRAADQVVQPRVDRLFMRRLAPEKIVAHLRSDKSLTAVELDVALKLVLRRCAQRHRPEVGAPES